jgi:hypothetical protein
VAVVGGRKNIFIPPPPPKKNIWQVFQRQCKNSKYKVNSAIQHLNKVMGQIFSGGGSCGGTGVKPTYASRRRRKNNLFAKDFKKKGKIAKKKGKNLEIRV